MRTPIAFACLGALLLAGCASTPEQRIAEKPDAYRQLDPDQQDRIKYGEIDRGFTADQVYIALGEPSRKQAAVENGVKVEVWSYRNYSPSLYRKPRPKPVAGGMPMSKGLTAFGESLPSGAGVHDDQIETPRGSNGTGGTMVDAPSATLQILFRDGKVAAVKLES